MFNKNSVIIGGKRVTVKKLTLDDAVQIALLAAPVLPYIENHKHEFSEALIGQHNPDVLSALFKALSEEMLRHIGVLSHIVAIMVGVDPQEFAAKVTTDEFIDMLPVLNRVHNIPRLYVSVMGLLQTIQEQQIGDSGDA